MKNWLQRIIDGWLAKREQSFAELGLLDKDA